MNDYNIVHKDRSRHTLRTLNNVARIENIPGNCKRVYFDRSQTTCKIKPNYWLEKIEKERV